MGLIGALLGVSLFGAPASDRGDDDPKRPPGPHAAPTDTPAAAGEGGPDGGPSSG